MAIEQLRPQQAADRLGVSRMTIYRWIREGRIRVSESAPKRTLISSAELARVHQRYGPAPARGALGNDSTAMGKDENAQPKIWPKSDKTPLEYYRPEGAAKRLGVSRNTVNRYLRLGLLRCSRPSLRCTLISSADLERFYKATRQPVPGERD
jgi:excisionase family DNA binding protein